jgi:chromate transporter
LVVTAAVTARLPADRPPAPTFAAALRFWLKLGCISFGGPAGQIAIMHAELVERRRWISERRFLHALNYCMLLPGPEAQQLATYIGWLLHRTWGGLVAGGLFVLPSLLVLMLLSWVYVAFGDLPVVAGVFYGIKPAVVAIVLHAAWRIGQRTLKNAWLWAIAAAAFIALFALRVPFPAIVLTAALIGIVGGRLAPRYFALGGVTPGDGGVDVRGTGRDRRRHADTSARARVAHAPAADRADRSRTVAGGDGAARPRPRRRGRSARHDGLVLHQGSAADLRRRLRGAALRLPGRGRALRLADRAADDRRTRAGRNHAGTADHGGGVRRFRWRLAGAAVRRGVDAFASAVLAACTVTFFTFLPSFLFIFVGGPLVESTHGDLRFTAPLTAITAAVVGVIVNLALFFAGHVFWTRGAVDVFAVALALVALLALLRFKLGVISVIAACALAGLAWHLLQR